LGQTIPVKKMKSILVHLGFGVTGAKVWHVTVPAWRLDVRQSEDLVDEIGRIVGYTDLPKTFPQVNAIPQPLPRIVSLKERIRDLLVDLGLTEVITHSYYGQAERQAVGGDHIAIANPLDASQAYVRRSLAPAVKKILERAVDAGRTVRVFEISRVFTSAQNSERGQDWKLAIGVAHKVQPGTPLAWKALGILRELCTDLSIDQPVLDAAESVVQKGYVLSWMEIDIHALAQKQKPKKFVEHSKFPAVDRDISMFIPTGFGFERVQRAIAELPAADRQLLRMDLLSGEWFAKDQQTSLKVHVVFQAMDRTLTKPEIDAVMSHLSSALTGLGATIR
jgi:phenylalanyl-tRNA synthetase beta chain